MIKKIFSFPLYLSLSLSSLIYPQQTLLPNDILKQLSPHDLNELTEIVEKLSEDRSSANS